MNIDILFNTMVNSHFTLIKNTPGSQRFEHLYLAVK